jgi:hypothetical protein
MHDTLGGGLSGIARYAGGTARLDPPAALRERATRRTRLRHGGAALLGVTAVTAAAVTFGLAQTSASTPGRAPATTALPASAQLTAYQSALLSKASVSQATVAALAGSGLTPAQIQILAQQILAVLSESGLTPAQSRALEAQKLALLSKAGLTPAQALVLAHKEAALVRAARLTAAEQKALARQHLTAAQLAALQKAHLSAAQMRAMQRRQQALAAGARQG